MTDQKTEQRLRAKFDEMSHAELVEWCMLLANLASNLIKVAEVLRKAFTRQQAMLAVDHFKAARRYGREVLKVPYPVPEDPIRRILEIG
ncbi:hypothetical protein [Ferrovibrio sp.]|uniref:hypothetical protein n=1 Tax=Ferrovibrio sp. TaxID=1917215 RepID=UPI0035B34EB2